MMGEFVWRNALYRPLRTLLGVVAIAVEVSLVLLIVGLTHGMLTEVGKRIEGVGADIMVQPPSSSVLLAFSGAPMPVAVGNLLRGLKEVKAVAPVLLELSSGGGLDIVYGIDSVSFKAVSDGFVYLEGHGLEQPYDVLVDDWYARARSLHAGGTLHLLGHDFHVAGVVEHGKGARVFVPLGTLQQLTGAQDKASLFFVKCVEPGDTDTVIRQITQLLPRYQIRPLSNFLSLMTPTSVPGLNTFVHAMIALAGVIGFLVIFLSMYATIVERTRDIGVLKSLGASKTYIVRALLGESTLICLGGIIAGILISYAAQFVMHSLFPTLTVLITPGWIARAAALAILAGLAGTTYPAWLASRKDPIEALAYE
ncbi:MAG TPA: ABC transporter permease [Candidatus Acidoferrales bacterium]|nr:ABC transporter permease [Candidatus Acidoferrales bacterium]